MNVKITLASVLVSVEVLSQARVPNETSSGALRIGQAASRCAVTARTLRYWQEIGLLAPSGQGQGSQRLYLESDLARIRRIRELQELLGLSLSEIRAVLEADDVVDELRSAYRRNAKLELQLRLLNDALEANAKLVARLDDTLRRVQAFREERAQKAKRMRVRARDLQGQIEASEQRGR